MPSIASPGVCSVAPDGTVPFGARPAAPQSPTGYDGGMNVVVVGAGYVGLANAVILARQHEVTVVDIDQTKVDRMNAAQSTVAEAELQAYLDTTNLNLRATRNLPDAVRTAHWTLIATPTDYNPATNYFDTTTVEQCIAQTLTTNGSSMIVVRSTVPVGFTNTMKEKYDTPNILFVPEFLREGHTLNDSLDPSRVIAGGNTDQAQAAADLLVSACEEQDVPVLLTGAREAEAIKLFANSYLALRVAYFNEIDTYAISEGLDARSSIEGIGLDPRIGNHYNNPSFGYGGYCLPKDTDLSDTIAGICLQQSTPHPLNVSLLNHAGDRLCQHIRHQVGAKGHDGRWAAWGSSANES